MTYYLNFNILCYYLNSDPFKTMKAVRTTTKEHMGKQESGVCVAFARRFAFGT